MVNKYTRPEPTNEDIAKTITNRLGQKSMSLPRIDDTKKLRGYPGLSGTAEIIARCVPKCLFYVEPFAGTAKVYQELMKAGRNPFTILNDKSKFTYNWLKQEFYKVGECIVTNNDFVYCAEGWNTPVTFTLFDQPWHKEIYLQGFSCFDRERVSDYDEQVLEICNKLQGNFIICTDRKNPRMLNSKFNNYMATGTYKVAGGVVKTLLTTNLKLDGIDGITVVNKNG